MPLVPEYQAMLEALAAEPGPPITAMTPEEARALYRMMRPLNDGLAVGEVLERRHSRPVRGGTAAHLPAAVGGAASAAFVSFTAAAG